MSPPFDALVDAFFAHFWSCRPVDASFAGVAEYDSLLPPAGADAPAREHAAVVALDARLAAVTVPDAPAARIDAALLRGYCAATLANGAARFGNPAWYTGEIAFGLIALLLPGAVPREARALAQRVAAIPDYLDAACAHLAARPVPTDWVRRATLEAGAAIRLLATGLPRHPLGVRVDASAAAAATAALEHFTRVIGALPDADPAAGAQILERLTAGVHGLDAAPAEIEAAAQAHFDELLDEVTSAARRLTPGESWRECVERLARPDVAAADVPAALRHWHARALAAGAELMTPATNYALEFAPLPDWAQGVAGDLYFLFYRSPAAFAPGSGSIYWTAAAQSTAAVKLIHAVHHGSIGHHTQNARARGAGSRLARIAGTDAASGIALLGAGTMAEGWACYAEDLLAEVPGFYTPDEELLLKAFELRNAATCLGDIRLHTGAWTLAEMRRFYRDEAAFAPERVWSETTRNSMFPASRLMYWTGTRAIRALRARSALAPKAFHDELLSYGSAPVAAVAREMEPRAARGSFTL